VARTLRTSSLLLGAGLAAFCAAGFNGATWLSIVHGFCAVISFVIAGAAPRLAPGRGHVAGPTLLTFVLFVSWMIAVAAAAEPWLSWGTFAFSFAYFMLAMDAAAREERAWAGPASNAVDNHGTDSERPREVA